jgi:hypothetical protein
MALREGTPPPAGTRESPELDLTPLLCVGLPCGLARRSCGLLVQHLRIFARLRFDRAFDRLRATLARILIHALLRGPGLERGAFRTWQGGPTVTCSPWLKPGASQATYGPTACVSA